MNEMNFHQSSLVQVFQHLSIRSRGCMLSLGHTKTDFLVVVVTVTAAHTNQSKRKREKEKNKSKNSVTIVMKRKHMTQEKRQNWKS